MAKQPSTPLTPEIYLKDGVPFTNSRIVARQFGKRHDNVIQAIESLGCSDDFRARNFAEMQIDVKIGNGATRKSKAYEMTKDGFVMLAMGFTGAKAMAWKEAYINAFNEMERRLRQPVQATSLLAEKLERLSRGVDRISGHIATAEASLAQVSRGRAFLRREIGALVELAGQAGPAADTRLLMELDNRLQDMRRAVWREIGSAEPPQQQQQLQLEANPAVQEVQAVTDPGPVPHPFRASPKLLKWFKSWLAAQGMTQEEFCNRHNLQSNRVSEALRGRKTSPMALRLKARIRDIVRKESGLES